MLISLRKIKKIKTYFVLLQLGKDMMKIKSSMHYFFLLNLFM